MSVRGRQRHLVVARGILSLAGWNHELRGAAGAGLRDARDRSEHDHAGERAERGALLGSPALRGRSRIGTSISSSSWLCRSVRRTAGATACGAPDCDVRDHDDDEAGTTTADLISCIDTNGPAAQQGTACLS